MSEFTRGALTAKRVPAADEHSYYIRDASGSAIGKAYAGFANNVTGETSLPAAANARLWAASNDLYEACKAALDDAKGLGDLSDDVIRLLENALDKAEGREVPA